MKRTQRSIPLAILAAFFATPVFALPSEPDLPCYLITPYGEAFDLSPMCSTVSAKAEAAPDRHRGAKSRNRGQVPQVAMQVYLSNGVWVTNGKIQNQTRQPISNVLVTLEILDRNGAVQTQNATVDQAFLSPGELGSFQVGINYESIRQVEGQQLAVPVVRVASVQWMNPDGSVGRYPY
ncbi:FxLYD domain-containing protein [Kovacikia minuta CCNUW1]|uniref:FxLYD domain-containing protein n=1 Tax=Kovacikia minuta TaxID=2931930 RepID=UPI001CCF69F5|nr:FxLYD domain-containing protein [Kovacikia minuta]UBF26864.1 FxLYD domain-containing protein [Kovacikia minuta CCNUW1]